MFHYTVFGGSEGEMTPREFCAVTLFGATTLRKPTIAQRIVELETPPEPVRQRWYERLGRFEAPIVVTLFGATELVRPSIAEEYAALRHLVTAGTLDAQRCRARLMQLLHDGGPYRAVQITLFGACSERAPSRRQEEKALATAGEAGAIPAPHRERLERLIGDPPESAALVVGELAFAGV